MAAYVVFEIQVQDPAAYAAYAAAAPATVQQYGGTYLVRGGKTEALEDGWQPSRFVLLEFPGVEQAKAWWNSPEYSAIKGMRFAAAHSRMFVVPGVEG